VQPSADVRPHAPQATLLRYFHFEAAAADGGGRNRTSQSRPRAIALFPTPPKEPAMPLFPYRPQEPPRRNPNTAAEEIPAPPRGRGYKRQRRTSQSVATGQAMAWTTGQISTPATTPALTDSILAVGHFKEEVGSEPSAHHAVEHHRKKNP
jgi:hypothetical protein